MNPVMQLYNTFRNRRVGAFLHEKGIKVIPTVNWGLENTFDFCFNGIKKGSVVAVSTYMVSEHGNHSDQKEFFMKGYNEMLKRIEQKSKGDLKMYDNLKYPDYNSFDSLSDFKWCILHGSEIEFVWKDKEYWITYGEDGKISVYQSYRPDTEKIYDNVDSLLSYQLETGEILKDIILKAEISSRTL